MIECLKALEREKIANGMQCTKADEVKLRAMQKMQMEEKRRIEQKNAEIDNLWHRLLLDDVKIKEEKEKMKAERLKQEMYDRRLAYDEQIASASRKSKEALQSEREEENRRLEKMKKRMERDYYDAIRRKKEQQMENKKNFTEGHEIKLSRLKNEQRIEKGIDEQTIASALEELRKERQKELKQIQTLKLEKEIFVDNYKRERRMANDLERDAEIIANQWKKREEEEADEFSRKIEMEKQFNRKYAAQEYKRHIDERNREIELKRQERKEAMERVKRTAYQELQKKLDSANEEMRWQIEYRHALTNQIRDNEKNLELELERIERKQKPFTREAITFKDAMKDKAITNISENPVHPFKRTLQTQSTNKSTVLLPSINKYGFE